MKYCSRCQKVKGTSEFNKDRTRADGFDNWCRQCVRDKSSTPESKAHAATWQRAWAQENRELATQRTREWQKRNKAKVNAANRARRARVTPTDPALVAEYYRVLLQDPCSYCGAPTTCVDHIVPVGKGGSPEWDNLTASCTECNSVKQARRVLIFLYERGQ